MCCCFYVHVFRKFYNESGAYRWSAVDDGCVVLFPCWSVVVTVNAPVVLVGGLLSSLGGFGCWKLSSSVESVFSSPMSSCSGVCCCVLGNVVGSP